MVSRAEIQAATDILVEAYQPKAIYLFGSYAWGEPTEDSDVDFYVVLEDDADMAWDAFRIATYAFYGAKVRFPTNVIVDKKNIFENRAAHPSSLERKIEKHGISLYRKSRRLAVES